MLPGRPPVGGRVTCPHYETMPGIVARLRLVLLLAFVALAARGLAGALESVDGEIRGEILTTGAGHRIAATVYVPPAKPGTSPRAVVLCHGISASRRHLDPMARELLRRGFLAIAFDFGGHGDSEDRPITDELNRDDVLAALGLAKKLGAAPPFALVGHSMGVLAAVGVAVDDPEVACVVALGQRPSATTERPRWLLCGAGAMDAFHPASELVAAVRGATTRDFEPFEDVVDPKTRAVRKVFLSGACEHAGEVYDGRLLGEAVAFIEASLTPGADPPRESGSVLRPPLSVSARFVSSAAAAGALVAFGLALAAASGTTRVARRLLTAGLLAVALAPFLLARAGFASVDLARSLTPPLLVGALVTGATIGKRPRASVIVALLLGWIAGTAVDAVPVWKEHPGLLAQLPLYLWQGVAFRIQFTLESLAARLIESPLDGQPHGTWSLYGIVGLEALFPGTALGLVAWFALRLYKGLGGRLPPREGAAEDGVKPTGEATEVPRKRLLLVLAVLVLVAAVLFWKRSSEGLLSEEGAVSTVLWTGVRLFVGPLVAFTGSVWLIRLVSRIRGAP